MKTKKTNNQAQKSNRATINYTELLQLAVTQEGVANVAYQAFHNYSLRNQFFAMMQILRANKPLSPIATYKEWQEKGRQVKKGETAIALFTPVTIKNNELDTTTGEVNTEGTKTIFLPLNKWFTYEQTEGEEYCPEIKVPTWDAEKAMLALNIKEVAFDTVLGNRLGYARDRTIAINPMNNLKHKTRFHEMAHVVLGHTANIEIFDDEIMDRSIVEAEAEGVAYILTSIFDLPGQAESRAYIQSWLSGKDLPEKSANHIFKAADTILKAGQNE